MMWCSSGSVSCLTLGSQQPGLGNQCISVTQTSAGPERVQSVWNVIYGRPKTTGHWRLNWCYVMRSCDFWWWLLHNLRHLGLVVMRWLASVSWLGWCDVCSVQVTWRDAVRVIMQWSQLSALTTTRTLACEECTLSVAGVTPYLQTAVQTINVIINV